MFDGKSHAWLPVPKAQTFEAEISFKKSRNHSMFLTQMLSSYSNWLLLQLSNLFNAFAVSSMPRHRFFLPKPTRAKRLLILLDTLHGTPATLCIVRRSLKRNSFLPSFINFLLMTYDDCLPKRVLACAIGGGLSCCEIITRPGDEMLISRKP